MSMEVTDAALEIVDLLGRRWEILMCLVEEPCDKRTLIDELDIPRSTLDRAVRELEAVELLTYTEGEYAVTSKGEYLAYSFSTFLERTEQTLELESFLQWMSIDEFSLDLRHLEDSELFLPESHDPYAMVNQHVKALEKANTFRGLLPVVGLHAFEMGYEQVVDRGARHEVITEPGVIETLQSDESYTSMYQELHKIDRFDVFVYEGSIPYFVGVFDDETVQIGVDEGGEPRALLETDCPEIRTWAHETIDEYEQQATRVFPNALQSVQPTNGV